MEAILNWSSWKDETLSEELRSDEGAKVSTTDCTASWICGEGSDAEAHTSTVIDSTRESTTKLHSVKRDRNEGRGAGFASADRRGVWAGLGLLILFIMDCMYSTVRKREGCSVTVVTLWLYSTFTDSSCGWFSRSTHSSVAVTPLQLTQLDRTRVSSAVSDTPLGLVQNTS